MTSVLRTFGGTQHRQQPAAAPSNRGPRWVACPSWCADHGDAEHERRGWDHWGAMTRIPASVYVQASPGRPDATAPTVGARLYQEDAEDEPHVLLVVDEEEVDLRTREVAAVIHALTAAVETLAASTNRTARRSAA